MNTAGDKKLRDWLKQVKLTEVPFLIRMMRRTQRMMNPAAYLAEHTAVLRRIETPPCDGDSNSEPGDPVVPGRESGRVLNA
jgi:hypothetical protein